jgi:hypothetical protein
MQVCLTVIPMYTTLERRRINRERLYETVKRADVKFFSEAAASARCCGIQLGKRRWVQVLDDLGRQLHGDDRGETVIHLQPQR